MAAGGDLHHGSGSNGSSAKMTGHAESNSLRKMRECTAMPPENAKAMVASNATRQSRIMERTRAAKIRTQPVAISRARTRPVAESEILGKSASAAKR